MASQRNRQTGRFESFHPLMKRPQYSDLPEWVQYGNGCGPGARLLNIPDFIFTANCNHHDFNYQRGCGAQHWYENIWKAPYWFTKANWDMAVSMWDDSHKWWHYLVSIAYPVGSQIGGWPWFRIGPWRSLKEMTGLDI